MRLWVQFGKNKSISITSQLSKSHYVLLHNVTYSQDIIVYCEEMLHNDIMRSLLKIYCYQVMDIGIQTYSFFCFKTDQS